MKISYLWLKSICDTNKEPEEIADLLTHAGLEVTHLTPFQFIPSELIVGKIIESIPHPNADKLFLTKVDIGQETPLSIVCGAPNATVDKIVVVAPVGTKLQMPNNTTLKIKKVKIRGEISEGMLCAEDEIGISNNHDQIITLSTQCQLGTPLEKVWDTPLDTIFEIDITPNRNDATHHFGVARDLAAKLERCLQRETNTPLIPCDSLPIHIVVKEPKTCPRYAGVVIKDLHVKPSPIWMQRCLKSIGLRPINNIVDITNFIMHDIGQPLHAFDYEKIQNKKLKIKKLSPGTLFTALDGITYTLTGEELMVCDDFEPLAMAGIIGGNRAKVTEETTTVFLESAYFDPISIYKTSKQHKIHTDASFQYSRGTNPCAPYRVLQRAVTMFKKYAHGSIASMFIDETTHKMIPKLITVTYKYINRLAGIEIPPKTIHTILTSLDMPIKQKTDTGFVVTVQPYRRDVEQPADIVEEILRIYGYEKLERNHDSTPCFAFPITTKSTSNHTSKLKRHLVAQGYHEIITNPLTSNIYTPATHTPILLDNPLNHDIDSLRTTMLFSGLDVIKNNISRGQQTIKLFEIGKIYYQQKHFHEINKLGLWITGYNKPASWAYQQKKMDVIHLQSIVKNLCQYAEIPFNPTWSQHEHYTTYLVLEHNKETYGYLGKVNNSITNMFGIHEEVFFAELDVEKFLQPRKLPIYQKLSKYPEVTRDISIAVGKQIPFSLIKEAINTNQIPFLQNFTLVDHYQGKSLQQQQKSYTMRFTFQSTQKTLTETEINHAMQHLTNLFEKNFQAIIRE